MMGLKFRVIICFSKALLNRKTSYLYKYTIYPLEYQFKQASCNLICITWPFKTASKQKYPS